MMLAATLHFGAEVKGARRWIVLLGVNIQPSEFVKPAFVILIAWLFAESSRKPEMPANSVAMGLLLLVVTLLVLQPDFGQTMLIALVWGALFFMAGMRLIWVAGLFGAAAIGLTGAYFTVPHVARRFKRFFDPSSGDTFQIDNAVESFLRGGWFGRGPGEGTVKRILPDSHADFVFAVAAEEFGIVLCLALVALFCFIVLRALSRALRNEDPFTRFARVGARHPVRHAIGDQHGGEPASHSGQGHDAAVHLLWRLVAAVARLWHGHAAGADARASARGIAGEPASRLPGARRERDERRTARPRGGRRHRRTSVSRRGAGGGARQARYSRSRSRPIPAPRNSAAPFRRARPCHSERDLARARSDLDRCAPRARSPTAS